jgi:uncharacterized protein
MIRICVSRTAGRMDALFSRTPRVAGTVALVAAGLLGTGCISVKAPERISINSSRPQPVDSRRVPSTRSHEEARAELNKAYQNIQYLEERNRKLERDAQEYKRERDECRRSKD